MRKTGPLRVIIDVKGMAEVDEADLKQQIVVLQEHFLFNTLNAIKGAAILEKVLLPELLDGLHFHTLCWMVLRTACVISFNVFASIKQYLFVRKESSCERICLWKTIGFKG